MHVVGTQTKARGSEFSERNTWLEIAGGWGQTTRLSSTKLISTLEKQGKKPGTVFTTVCFKGGKVGRQRTRLGLLLLSMWEVTTTQGTAREDWRSNPQNLVETQSTPDVQTRRRFMLKMMRSTGCCPFVLKINKEPTQAQVLFTLRYYICLHQNDNYRPERCLLMFTWKTFSVLPLYMYRQSITFACWQQAGKQQFCEAFGRLDHFRKWPKCFSTNSARVRVLFHTVGRFWVLKKKMWLNYTALRCCQATCHCSQDNNSWQMGFL